MFFAIAFIIVAFIVFLSGGNLENLKNLNFKYPWLVLIALLIKIFCFTGIREIFIEDILMPYIYVFSLFLIVLFVVLNLRIVGLPILGLGLISNTLVIILNNGYMPVKDEYIPLIASAEDMAKINMGQPAFNYIKINAETKLPFLADIFLMPDWIPMTKVFSIGDIFILIGGVVFILYYSMKRKKLDYN